MAKARKGIRIKKIDKIKIIKNGNKFE